MAQAPDLWCSSPQGAELRVQGIRERRAGALPGANDLVPRATEVKVLYQVLPRPADCVAQSPSRVERDRKYREIVFLTPKGNSLWSPTDASVCVCARAMEVFQEWGPGSHKVSGMIQWHLFGLHSTMADIRLERSYPKDFIYNKLLPVSVQTYQGAEFSTERKTRF